MNLLIIGAGGYGRVVKETAEITGQFKNIVFLDHNSGFAIGKCDEYQKFINQYKYAFVALSNNEIRRKWVEKLRLFGFLFPILIHPTAYVSPSAEIESGVIIQPKAVIHTNAIIKRGSIIGVGSLIDHDVTINEFCHINTGAIVQAGCDVKNNKMIEVGIVWSGKPMMSDNYNFEVGM